MCWWFRSARAWIEVVTREDRGRRAVGPGVIEAFYAGYGQAAGNRGTRDWLRSCLPDPWCWAT